MVTRLRELDAGDVRYVENEQRLGVIAQLAAQHRRLFAGETEAPTAAVARDRAMQLQHEAHRRLQQQVTVLPPGWFCCNFAPDPLFPAAKQFTCSNATEPGANPCS